jgi:Flp pilus assembly protein TadG
VKRIVPVRRPAEPGQGTVEFALVVPLFLLLALGIVEFSWALYTQSTLAHAAYEGARRGMVLTRIANSFTTPGNSTGTYDPLPACSGSTIVGTSVCHLGAVAASRTTAIVCPSSVPNDCPTTPSTKCPNGAQNSNECYLQGLRVEIRLDHTYRPLVLGFFPGLNNIVMTGHAEMRTQ